MNDSLSAVSRNNRSSLEPSVGINMEFEQVLAVVDEAIKPGYLNHVQELVLQKSWEGRTYSEIAADTSYDSEYIKGVGCDLWKLLSDAFSERVTKNNLRQFLRRRVASHKPNGMGTTSAPSKGEISVNPRQNWGDAPDVSSFEGRSEELTQLHQWINGDRCRLVTILGMVGIGKTTLAVKFAEQVQDQFEFVIWRSLRNAPSIEETLTEIISFLSDQQVTELPTLLDSKILLLLDYLGKHRCLLLLDDLQSVLHSGNFEAHYRPGYEGYGQLLRSLINARHQSFLILTSREKPRGLTSNRGNKARSLKLGALKKPELRDLLEDQTLFSDSDEHWQVLFERYAGNPQLLRIATTAVQEFYHGNIAHFLNQKRFVFDEVRTLLDQQFNQLPTLEKEITYWLAINREPVPIEKLTENLVQPVPEAKLRKAVFSLEQKSLIEGYDYGYTLQLLFMEYLTYNLVEKICEENFNGQGNLWNGHARCTHCGLGFKPDDFVEIHYKNGDPSDSRRKNLALLHYHCYKWYEQAYGQLD